MNILRIFEMTEFFSLVISIALFTVLEVVLVHFLKDFKISKEEDSILETITNIGYGILAVFILSNVGIYVLTNSLFVDELYLMILLVVNMLAYNIKVLPRIKKSFQRDTTSLEVQKVGRLRKLAFIQSFLSLIIWYTLFYVNFIY